jgi:type III restriction enzyme
MGQYSSQLPVSLENVNDLFRAALRLISSEVANSYWQTRANEDASTLRIRAKLEVVALATDSETRVRLEEAASSELASLMQRFMPQVPGLPEERQAAYYDVWSQGANPVFRPLTVPQAIDVRKSAETWPKHLYSENNGFPFGATGWEKVVLQEELARLDVVGWLRNPDRKEWSLVVPYESAGQLRPFYPDFLVFRVDSGKTVIDILDPHNDALTDWWEKAKGLAKYADAHWPLFGRIEIAVVRAGRSIRMNLANESSRRSVMAVTDNNHLRSLMGVGQ